MTFAEEQYLIALAAVPLLLLLAVLAAVSKRRAISRMGDKNLLSKLALGHSPDRRGFKAALVLAALACALLSAARPQVGWQLTRGSASGIDLAIALDVSASMLAEDVAPSRLGRAKSELAALVSELGGDRIAIVAFAGSAIPVCPLTGDSRAAMTFLDALRWGIVEEPGTDLGKALDRALRTFDSAEDRSRAILIVSDGEDHEGGFGPAADRALEAGIPVYCVGVGGQEGVPIPISPGRTEEGLRKDSEGRVVLTKLNPEVLAGIARATKGAFYTIGPSGGGLRRMRQELEELPRRERPTSYTHRSERFHIAALIAVCLLALEWMISERRRSAAAAALIAVLLLPAAPAAADRAGDAVKLYKEGDYLGALAKFREALEENPSAPLYYDVGNSLYRLEKFDEAARHYMDSITEADSSLEMRARYNAGNTLFRSGKIEGAIDQYVEALKLNPNDEDAKHNLEIALRKLQESRDNPQGQEGEEQDDREGEEPQGEQEDAEGRGESESGEDRSEPEGGESGEGRSEAEDGMDRPPSPLEEEAGRFTKEEAERLLEALASDERDLLIERLKSRVRRKGVKKDW